MAGPLGGGIRLWLWAWAWICMWPPLLLWLGGGLPAGQLPGAAASGIVGLERLLLLLLLLWQCLLPAACSLLLLLGRGRAALDHMQGYR